MFSDKKKHPWPLPRAQRKEERCLAAWPEGNPHTQIREIRKNKIGFQKTPTTFAKSVKKGGKLLLAAWPGGNPHTSHHPPPGLLSLVCLCNSSVSCLPLLQFWLFVLWFVFLVVTITKNKKGPRSSKPRATDRIQTQGKLFSLRSYVQASANNNRRNMT